MKRTLALLLTIALLLTLSACGGSKGTTPTGESDGTTVNTNEPTDGTQSTTEGITGGESTETTEPPATTTPTESTPNTTTTPTEGNTPTTPPTTEPKPTNPKPTEPTPTQPTPTEPTPTQPKPTEPKPTEPTPTQPKPTEPTPTEPAKEGKYVGYEIVSVTIPNKYTCSNGQDLLSRMYGKNKAFQIGDSIVIRIKMSEGTAQKVEVTRAYSCSYTINGDCITVTCNSANAGGGIDIRVTNADGTTSVDGVYFTIVDSENLAADYSELKQQFRKYGTRKGLTYIVNGTDFVEKYNGGYTKDDESKSITGLNRKGTDDYIPIPGNSDWIEEVLWLVDQYASMGFVRWTFDIVMADGFDTLAE